MRGKHFAKDCTSRNCKISNKRHNSLLHVENTDKSESKTKQDHKETDSNEKRTDNVVCNHSNLHEVLSSSQVLLSTAVVKIKHKDGHYVKAKALLDNGSQSNFVSDSLVKRLKLNLRDSHIEIKGINQQVSNALKITDLEISSYFESFTTKLRCVVLPSVTQRVPNIKVNKGLYNIPKNIRLADPQFNIPSEIDLLIGAEKFWDMICVGQIKLGDGKSVLQKTLLGWIVAGKVTSPRNNMSVSCNFSCMQELDETLRKFWQIENIEGSQNVTSRIRIARNILKKLMLEIHKVDL